MPRRDCAEASDIFLFFQAAMGGSCSSLPIPEPSYPGCGASLPDGSAIGGAPQLVPARLFVPWRVSKTLSRDPTVVAAPPAARSGRCSRGSGA